MRRTKPKPHDRSLFLLLLQHLRIFALFLLLPTAVYAEFPDTQRPPKQERGLVHYAPKFKPSSYIEFPDILSLPTNESVLAIYAPDFRTRPFMITVRQFMSLFYSDRPEDRRYAELFLAGVLDTIEGKSWCGYARTKSDSILDVLHTGLGQLGESKYNERAASVITEIMHKVSLCKEQ